MSGQPHSNVDLTDPRSDRFSPERVAAHGFMFVTDRVPLSTMPTGFSDRYAGFLHKLAERAPTTLVIGLRRSTLSELGLDAAALQHELANEFPELAGIVVRPPRSSKRPLQRLIEGARAVVGPRQPGTPLPDFEEASTFAGVLLLVHSSMAHLGIGRAGRGDGGTVYLLEEEMERAPRNESTLTPMQRRRSALVHTLLVHSTTFRLFRKIGAEDDPVVVLNETEASIFSRWIKPSNIVVLPLSVQVPDQHQVRNPPSPTPVVVGILGRIGDDRNALPTIEVLEELRKGDRPQLAALRWLIVGSNPPEPLRRLSSEQVTVTGYVPDMAAYYEQVDVILIPSSSATGSKTTLLRAWSYGIPVVISDAAAATMPVDDEVNALIAHGPDGHLRALERLCTDAALRDRIITEGRRSLEPFDPSRAADRLLSVATPGLVPNPFDPGSATGGPRTGFSDGQPPQ